MKRHKKKATILLIFIMFAIVGCQNSPQPVKILEEDQVKNEVAITTQDISLSNRELENFQKYSETENEQLLKDLTPLEIFKYYYHAFSVNDQQTLYNLYIKGEAYGTPNRKEFLEEMEKKDIAQLQLLNNFQYSIENFAQINYDDKTSYIQVNFKEDSEVNKSQPWNFKLIKNSQDIWKVDWVPLEVQ